MKYLVIVKEESWGAVEVEACSRAQAEALAEIIYNEGMIPWNEAEITLDTRILKP